MKRMLVTMFALAAIAGVAPLFSGANFAVQTLNPQTASAAADFVAPTIGTSVIADTTSGAPFDGPGYVAQGGTYRIYANVTDASTISSVTADVTAVSDGGHAAVPLVAGSYTVGGVTYGYASAEQTAGTPLSEGSKSYTVTATDSAANSSSPASFSVTVDNTAPTVGTSTIARTDGVAPGFVRQGDSYFVYANASDASSGIHDVTANVNNVTTGATPALTTAGGPWTVDGTTYTYRSASLTAGASLTDGSKAYTVTARDNATNSSAAAGFSVTADSSAPSVSLTTPAGNAIVRASIAPAATASDADGIAAVKIQRSPAGAGTWTDVCTITGSSPYSCSFDTTTISDGLYDFRAVATDKAANTATSLSSNVRVDNTAPAVTMAGPGSSLSGTVTLQSSSATDGGSGVASVKYQYAPTGTTTWSDACTGTTGPSFSCSFDTTAVSGGGYDFRALATDNAGNTGTSATITNVQISQSGPVGVLFEAKNCAPVSATCVAGQANAGDTIAFTYSKAMNPATIIPATTSPVQAAWDGVSPRTVKVNLTQGGGNDTLTEVQLDTGNTVVSLGTVQLGADYLKGTSSSFTPSSIASSNGGKTFTITLGPFVGTGTLQPVPTNTTPLPQVIWTPDPAAKDFNGTPVSTTNVLGSFVAF